MLFDELERKINLTNHRKQIITDYLFLGFKSFENYTDRKQETQDRTFIYLCIKKNILEENHYLNDYDTLTREEREFIDKNYKKLNLEELQSKIKKNIKIIKKYIEEVILYNEKNKDFYIFKDKIELLSYTPYSLKSLFEYEIDFILDELKINIDKFNIYKERLLKGGKV